MKIEDATYIDLPAILDLQKLCYRENAQRYDDYKIPPLVQTIDELKDDFKNSLILKVEDNAKIIASIRAYEKDDTCYIGRVIVHPAYQNKGIGTKMMAEMENRFPQSGRFELFTGYRDEKNIYFYGKLGYKIFMEASDGGNIKFVYFEKVNTGKNKN